MTIVEQGFHAFGSALRSKWTLGECLAIGLMLGIVGVVSSFMA